MRKLLLAALSSFGVGSYPRRRRFLRIPIPIATFCCQFGESYGATTFSETPSCKQEIILDAAACTSAGGKVVAGTCNADGNCGGATTCCEGVSVGQSCTEGIGGSFSAVPNSCAPATESACDALSPAGERATESVPGGTCSEGQCTVPEAPPR
jgi:hypothetical protein